LDGSEELLMIDGKVGLGVEGHHASVEELLR
jgi:hypothetical protein